MNKLLVPFLCLILVACSSSDEESKTGLNAAPLTKEKAVSLNDFLLADIQNQPQRLENWQGKVIILNFWATWCPPCRREMPGFVELDEEFSQQGLQMIGIAIDEKSAVTDFVDSMGIEFPILIGGNDAITIAKHYGNRHGALPYSVVIDRQGFIRHQIAGELSKNEAIDLIKPLL